MIHSAAATNPGWAPSSPCDERCVPAASRQGNLRSAVRGVALAAAVLTALAAAALLPLLRPAARASWLRVFARSALGAAGVRLRVRGPRPPPGTGVLVVANHVSWIEILALSVLLPVRHVAKHEIRRWPVVGAIAASAGTLFIDRAGLRSLPATVAELRAALLAGSAVAVFPEGTTWCGAAAGPFRRAVFQAALDAHVPVLPVAVTLRRAGGVAADAAFVGELGLLASVGRVLRLAGLTCELTLLPTIAARGTRAELAAAAAAAITAATGVTHAPWPASAAPLGSGTPRRAMVLTSVLPPPPSSATSAPSRTTSTGAHRPVPR